MCRYLVPLACLVQIVSLRCIALAEWYSLGAEKPKPISVVVERSNAEETVIRYEIRGFERESVVIDGQTYTKISIPGASLTQEKGLPELPWIGRNLMIPTSELAKLDRVVEMKTTSIDLGPVIPSKGPLMRNVNPADVPYTFGDFYQSDRSYPSDRSKQARLGRPFTLREVTGVNLAIVPLRYDRKSGKTTVATDVTVTIQTTPRGPEPTLWRKKERGGGYSADFLSIYQGQFVNFGALTDEIKAIRSLPSEQGPVLFISPPEFVASLKPLIEWKRQKGFVVTLETINKIGMDYRAVKKYIQKTYDETNLAHVILVGDAEFVPYHVGTEGNVKGNEADPMYSLVEGADSYPDLFVSRLSARTTGELDNIVARIVNYEKNPDVNGNWYALAAGIASAEGSPPDWQRADDLRLKLLQWHYTSVDRIYDPNAVAATVSNSLNAGRGFVNYIGHGAKDRWVTTGFNNARIDQLTNAHRLPFIVCVACLNGDFGAGADCFAERWLKAGTVEQPTGAIAVFASSTNQAWLAPTIGQAAIVDLLVREQAQTVGGLFVNGSVAVLAGNPSRAVQTFQSWHIFGDSTLEVRTRKPEKIAAEIPAQLAAGIERLTFPADSRINVGVVVGDELIGRGGSGGGGTVDVNLKRPLSSGDKVLVTLSGFNKIPIQQEILVP